MQTKTRRDSDKNMSEKSSLRTKFEIILLFLTVVSVTFLFVEAQTNYLTVKPMLAKIYPQAAEVKINEVKFFYDPLILRYLNVSVSISNVGYSLFEGKTVVSMYNATNTIIAVGEKTFSLQPQMTIFLNVILGWSGNMTIVDYAYAIVNVV